MTCWLPTEHLGRKRLFSAKARNMPFTNKLTGWTGLTNIAQAMYVYKMYKIRSSNGFKKLETTEPLEAIQKELTHPYLLNSAKEIYDEYVME